MRCPFCGYEFKEEEGRESCRGCPTPLGTSCNMMKCPRCGYESPMESRLLKALKRWRERRRR